MKEEANVESVISKGSTVDEAVRLGLEKLQTTRDQVSIEVIQTCICDSRGNLYFSI